jgi:single-strand DNA-binding protein
MGTASPNPGSVSGVNDVRLIGRVSGAPEEKVLPSGDVLWQFRLVVPRPNPIGKQSVDVVDCVAWSPKARRSVSRWASGDHVEVLGALRRRFYRGVGRTESRTEVEVVRGRILRRAIGPSAVVSRNACDV